MACNIKTINRDQIYLMPPSLQEWLPEKDMAWFVINVVEQMDLSRYYGSIVRMGGDRRAMIRR